METTGIALRNPRSRDEWLLTEGDQLVNVIGGPRNEMGHQYDGK